MPVRLVLLGLVLWSLSGCEMVVRRQSQASLSLMGAESFADYNHESAKAKEYRAAEEELNEVCAPLQRATVRGNLGEEPDLFDDVVGGFSAPFCWGKSVEIQHRYAGDPGFTDPYGAFLLSHK